MSLRRRHEKRVMEAMSGMTRLAIGHKSACTESDLNVDRMNPVAEGRDKPIEPTLQGVCPLSPARRDSPNCGLKFDQGRCGKKMRLVMRLEPASQRGSLGRCRPQTRE
jgi:hypothetical protein